jgi:hypothetical protein
VPRDPHDPDHPADFEVDVEVGADAAPPADRYPLIWLADAQARVRERTMVRGLLRPETMIVTYGESNSGKTFHVLDRDICLAAGRPWYGRETTGGLVVYIAAEGAHSVETRAAAYRDTYMAGAPSAPLAIIAAPVDLLRPDADCGPLVDYIRSVEDRLGIGCVKVTADTLARVIAGGNENAPDDMGALVRNADGIRHALGCAFEFIHHAGKDTARGARGHSSLRAATDTEIEVTATDGVHSATVTKQRDLPTGDTFAFRLRVIELGSDEYGHPVTTCVPEWCDAPDRANRQSITGAQRAVLGALHDLLRRQRQLPPRSCQAAVRPPKPGQTACPEVDLRAEVIHRGGVTDSDKPDSQSRAYRRALHGLRDRAAIELYDGWVWLADNPDKAGQPPGCPAGPAPIRPGQTGHTPMGVSGCPAPGCPDASAVSDPLRETANDEERL